jgi:hypothetical protein
MTTDRTPTTRLKSPTCWGFRGPSPQRETTPPGRKKKAQNVKTNLFTVNSPTHQTPYPNHQTPHLPAHPAP